MRVSTNLKSSLRARSRQGFTLVELLVVISIIGVLVGLTVPAVFAVRNSFNRSAVKLEVQGLAQAVEAYRTKFGDYPPDGSSWILMERHLRKAFPNMLSSEFMMLNPSNNGENAYVRNDYAGMDRVMDPAEALVFFLGGFSSDSQRPLSGKGGPFVKTSAGTYVYNMQRDNAFYEFNASRLTLTPDATGTGGVSTDETLYGGTGDMLPVYLSYNAETPYVYFNHLTYELTTGGGDKFYNFHSATPLNAPNAAQQGVARPLLAASPTATAKYAASKSFQVISPGIDGMYGWMAPPSGGSLILFSETGQGYSMPAGTISTENRFRLPIHGDRVQPMWDNVASCLDVTTFRDATVGQ